MSSWLSGIASRGRFLTVTVPYPLTPLVAFLYFLYREAGTISARTPVYYQWSTPPNEQSASLVLGESTLRIAGAPVHVQAETLIDLQREDRRERLRNLYNFLRERGRRHGRPTPGHGSFEALAKFLLVPWAQPRRLLARAAIAFARHLREGGSPSHGLSAVPAWDYCSGIVGIPPRSMQYLTRAKFDTSDTDEPRLVGQEIIGLPEDILATLQHEHLSIAICGDPGVGKSSVAAGLVPEMQVALASLCSRNAWKRFGFPVTLLDLDYGSQTSEAILSGRGHDGDYLASLKTQWTPELAHEAQVKFASTIERNCLTVADTPGLRTDVLRTILVPAHFVILVYNRSEQLQPWFDFFSELRTPRIATVRTGSSAGTVESLLRSQHVHSVYGSVQAADRLPRSYDGFIRYLAAVLLFGILPGKVTNRNQRAHDAYKRLIGS